ncbi:hypothetical protein LSAT2_011168 [Lamellibrachia satsuma]|nr:hypothetical protein LSAT2_011168 [Lamellibrachia satsuma]
MTDKPTVVYVEIYLVRLGPVDQSKLEFDMDIFLRQRWVDPRLTNPYERGADSRSMHYALKECMWVPDLIFINEMHSSFHEFTVLNQLLHILPNGRITFSQRLALTLMCNMDLTNFPLDSQTCSVRLESYGIILKEVLDHGCAMGTAEQEAIIIEATTRESVNKVAVTVNGQCVELLVDSESIVNLLDKFTFDRKKGTNLILRAVTKKIKLFEGLGKLNRTKIKLHIDTEVKPTSQSRNRIPFHMRRKVEEELVRLEKRDSS